MLWRPMLQNLGIDPYQLKVILQTKCMVDDRRPSGLRMYRKSSRRTSGWLKNVGFFFYGAMISGTLFIGSHLMGQSIYLTAMMIYATSSLITDFSNVLIDVRDHYFIVSRPVSDQTVAAARLFHILIYLGKTFIPLFLPGIIIVFIVNGIIPGLLFLVELASATTLSVFAVNVIYMLMLQFMKPQKFRDIIAYFQIGFNILIFAGYIIFPQFVQRVDIKHINPTHYLVSYFMPPVWIATLQNWAAGNFTHLTFLFSALAIITPALCLMAIVSLLSADYNSKLTQMGSASEDAKSANRASRERLSDVLATLFTTSSLDKLGFKITWKLTSRMNQFKSRVYPSFAFVPLYFFYWAFINGSKRSFIQTWHHLPQTSFYLFILYAIGYMAIVIIRHVTRSEKFKAAWFYQISPTEKPGLVLSGMIKAIVAKYLLPSAIVAVIFILWIWGIGKWLNIIFALISVLLITVIMALIRARKFPFSVPADLNQQKGQRFMNIFLILIPLGLGYFQSYIAGYTLVIIILSVIYLAITWALFRTYINMNWSELLEE